MGNRFPFDFGLSDLDRGKRQEESHNDRIWPFDDFVIFNVPSRADRNRVIFGEGRCNKNRCLGYI